MLYVARGSAYCSYHYIPLPTSQELIHWLILVGIRVIIPKSNVDDGGILDFSLSSNENITTQFSSPI